MPIDNRWYDRLGAQWWDPRGPVAALHEVNPVRVGYFVATLRRVRADGERLRVLDAGCGGGLVAEAMAREGFDVIGLDASLPSLRAGRDHARADQVAVDYIGGDATHLPFAADAFDAVVCSEVIEHVDDPDALLREVARVLVPHGVLLFDTPNRTWFSRVGLIWVAEALGWAPRHTHDFHRLLTPDEFRARSAAAGLSVQELRGLSLVRSALPATLGYLRRRELGGFRLSDDQRLSYIGYATLAHGGRPVLASPAEDDVAGPGSEKLWGGRFSGATDELVEAYNASIGFDRRLYREDIAGSIAHAKMLARQEIISEADRDAIVAGLKAIRDEIDAGDFEFRVDREDIHLNIEAALAERIGEPAGRLHTARSRNDQVATDLRLFARAACGEAVEQLRAMRTALLDLAEREEATVLPGYTHLQRAQPVLLAHHLLAYEAMLARDTQRFGQARARANVLPLGAGALAGVTYPVDRDFVARELGFDAVAPNSLDAVSDRDFVVDFHAAAALAMVHLSRLAEEVILWSSAEFGLVRLDDAFATGSSIMPQKKNPDVAELARGKSARAIGNLVQALTMLKGQPLAYNKDLQEDKESLFDSVDTLLASTAVMAAMLPALQFDAERGARMAVENFALATDIADYLAKRGVPFREAHAAVGKLVARCEQEGKVFEDLTLDEFRAAHEAFEADVLEIDLQSALAARSAPGGTAPATVERQRRDARARLQGEHDA